jgi:hypothetical protein
MTPVLDQTDIEQFRTIVGRREIRGIALMRRITGFKGLQRIPHRPWSSTPHSGLCRHFQSPSHHCYFVGKRTS